MSVKKNIVPFLLSGAVFCFASACESDSEIKVPLEDCSGDVKQCQDKKLLECKDGKWKEKITCTNEQICDASTADGCKAVTNECTDGAKKCEGKSFFVCENKTWGGKRICGDKEECDVDEATGCKNKNAGPAKQCSTDGEKKCENNKYFVCENKSWAEKRDCGATEKCDVNEATGCKPLTNCATDAECTDLTESCIDEKCLKIAIKDITGHDGSNLLLHGNSGKHEVILNAKVRQNTTVSLEISNGTVGAGNLLLPGSQFDLIFNTGESKKEFWAMGNDGCKSETITGKIAGSNEVGKQLICQKTKGCNLMTECEENEICDDKRCVPFMAEEIELEDGSDLTSVHDALNLKAKFNGKTRKAASAEISVNNGTLKKLAADATATASITLDVPVDAESVNFHLASCTPGPVTFSVKTGNAVYTQNATCAPMSKVCAEDNDCSEKKTYCETPACVNIGFRDDSSNEVAIKRIDEATGVATTDKITLKFNHALRENTKLSVDSDVFDPLFPPKSSKPALDTYTLSAGNSKAEVLLLLKVKKNAEFRPGGEYSVKFKLYEQIHSVRILPLKPVGGK